MILSKKSVLSARYACFGLLIVLNAVICTVAVYNFTLAKELRLTPGVDAYLIFLSALALLFIIPTVFVDLLYNDVYICRVWMECCWIAWFWVAELVAAIAFTATVPSALCDASQKAPACTSSHALEACIWLCMLVLFAYLAILIVSAAAHERLALNVWQTGVRHFPWFEDRLQVDFPHPAPPYRHRHSAADPTIVAPNPRQLLPRFRMSVPISIRQSMGRPSARIPPPIIQEPNMDVPLPGNPAPPPPARQSRTRLGFSRRSSARTANRPNSRHPYDPEAFFPEHLQAALQAVVYDASSQAQERTTVPPRRQFRPLPFPSLSSRLRPPSAAPVAPPSASSRPLPTAAPARRPPPARPSLTIDTAMRRPRPLPPARPAPPSIPVPASAPLLPPSPVFSSQTSASISPLGEWPRANALSLPLRPRKRPPPPPSSFQPAIATVAESPQSRPASGSSDEGALSSANMGSLAARRSLRPTGPRTRQGSLTSNASA